VEAGKLLEERTRFAVAAEADGAVPSGDQPDDAASAT